MADDVTLKLGGDSHELIDAVIKGGHAFTQFATKVTSDAKSLQKSLREVSGADVIGQANEYAKAVGLIGGATKLTTSEKAKLNSTLTAALEKYRAMGVEAPEALHKLAAQTSVTQKQAGFLDATMGKLVASFSAASIIDRGIGMLVSFGREAFETAGKTVDLANKTGLSTEYIQRMAAAASATGVSLEGLSQASYQLGIRVEAGSKKVRDAAADLGLEWHKLKDASPDEKMQMVMAALERMVDPTRRNTDAQALFGGMAKEAAQAAADGYSKAADAAAVSSDAQVRALKNAGDAWTKFKLDVGTGFGQMMGDIVLGFTSAGIKVNELTQAEQKQFFELQRTIGSHHALLQIANERAAAEKRKNDQLAKESKPAEASYAQQLKDVAKEVKDLTTAQYAEIAAGIAVGKTNDEINERYGHSEEAIAAVRKAIEKKTETEKQAAAKSKQLAEEEKKRQDELFGRDLITRANQYVKELGGVENLTRLSKEQTEKLAAAVAAGLAAYERLGQTAPEALKKLGAATAGALAGFEKSKTIDPFGFMTFDKNDPTAPIVAGFEKLKTLNVFDILMGGDNKSVGGPTAPILEWSAKMAATAKQLPGIITQAFTSGGGWQGALSGSASAMSSAAMGHLFGEAGKSGITKGMTGMMGNVLSAAGPVIGALAGPLMDMVIKHFHKPEHVRIMQDVGRDWGVNISEGLAKQIEKDAADKFGKDRTAGSLFNLDKIIGEAGGLSDANLAKFTGKLRDVFSMFESGKFTAAQTAEVLDKNWSAFVQHSTDGNGRISASLKEIIGLNDRMSVQSKEIAAWQRGQATTAITGFNAVVAGMTSEWRAFGVEIDKAFKKTKDAEDALMKATEQRTFAAALAKVEEGRWDDLAKKVYEASDAEQALYRQRYALAQGAKQQLEDLGLQAVASFSAAVASGASFGEALKTIAPGAKDLNDAFTALGIETDNVALKTLLLQSTILDKNPQLIGAVDGLGQQMIALDNLGLMNVETFGAMERTGSQLYTRLQSAAAAAGGSTRDALMPMQGWLQKAAEQSELLGIPLSANTQELIEQSRQLGLWKERGESANDIMAGGFKDVAAAVRELKDFLLGVVSATQQIPRQINVAVQGTWEPPDMSDMGLEGHARGYVGTRPHLARVSEGGRAEIIGDVDFMTRALSGAMARMQVMQSSVTGATTMPVMLGGGSGGGIHVGQLNIPITADSVDRSSIPDLARRIMAEAADQLSGLVPVAVTR